MRSPREMTDGKRKLTTVESWGGVFRFTMEDPINRSRTWGYAENTAVSSEGEQRKVKGSASP